MLQRGKIATQACRSSGDRMAAMPFFKLKSLV
jgi:hypothetical protein